MKLDRILDLFLPGDIDLKVPSFSKCDDPEIIKKFIEKLPYTNFKNINDKIFKENDLKKIIKDLKSKGIKIDFIIEESLKFYFSRSLVVKPLTGRDIPYVKTKYKM